MFDKDMDKTGFENNIFNIFVFIRNKNRHVSFHRLPSHLQHHNLQILLKCPFCLLMPVQNSSSSVVLKARIKLLMIEAKTICIDTIIPNMLDMIALLIASADSICPVYIRASSHDKKAPIPLGSLTTKNQPRSGSIHSVLYTAPLQIFLVYIIPNLLVDLSLLFFKPHI